ncbi:Cell shape-determining protein MreC [Caulifigura coniformis]|uniref:Cell shape-determining protein MreC n=1 Tax=Caulifigura coniformis TaxID=2527983 RepID=A0A517S8G9_9PLAN|nr:rod shape-determining protein MreC [Caulifigura coniformis]QDT52412.1 Cell shape-determining protein MreC [Caulifigura coniformis]
MARSHHISWLLAAACLGAGGVLCAAPAPFHERVRGLVLDLLKPGMSAVVALRERRPAAISPKDSVASRERELELSRQLEQSRLDARRLQIEAARLRGEMDELRSEKPKPFVGETGLPLFAPDLLTARVLDTPSMDEIERTILTLGEGHAARVALAEWVLGEDGVTIDQGRDTHVLADSPVLSGRSVFGRVASAGRFTSRVQHISDTGFRAHAKLVRRSREKTVSGSEGLLVGAGEGLCRLELIAATEPVEPGDMVVTAATIPGIDEELYLGDVEKAELSAGASHWVITVRPAVSVSSQERVQVVRVGLHPGRKPVEGAEDESIKTAQRSEGKPQ